MSATLPSPPAENIIQKSDTAKPRKSAPDGAADTKKSKKRKTQHTDDDEKSKVEDATKKDRKKKKQKLDVPDDREDDPEPEVKRIDASGGKEKRRKKKEGIIQLGSDNNLDAAKKRKRRNETGFPDPNEDASLAEQAQKTLAYAFLQFHRPSKWKFNKGRQNWIIRNVWSIEMIPEIYLPLVTAYLSKVQGGVRENLLKTCREKLEPTQPATPQALPEGTLAPTEQKSPPTDAIKQSRPQTILDALSSLKETPDSDSLGKI